MNPDDPLELLKQLSPGLHKALDEYVQALRQQLKEQRAEFLACEKLCDSLKVRLKECQKQTA